MKRIPGVTIKAGRYYRAQYLGMVDGKRRYKWHPLTRVDDGEAALFKALADLSKDGDADPTKMESRVTEWLAQCLPGLSAAEQREVSRMSAEIKRAFVQFRTPQVQAKHILQFVNRWVMAKKLRTAQRYRTILNTFFRWVVLQGDRTDNPVEPVRVKAPSAHDHYITDDEFLVIRDKLLGEEGHRAASGEMLQVYVDLLYLLGQRGQDIRTLRWSQIDEAAGVIRFKPSKTAQKNGIKVDKVITDAVANVLQRAKDIGRRCGRISPYVVTNLAGDPYTRYGVNTAWVRARKRAGIEQGTLKDIRAKHATDLKRAGYSDEEIQDSLAHEDTGTTKVYIKQRVARVSKVELALPVRK